MSFLKDTFCDAGLGSTASKLDLIDGDHEEGTLSGSSKGKEPICSLRESWTKGSSGVRPFIHWAGLMGYEDMKAEDYTRVWIGLSLAWKAS